MLLRPLDEVRRFLQKNGFTHCRICAALSGGADSVCLLDCLQRLSGELSLDICAVHVQHGLRGAESDRDEQFCRDFCQSRHIPLTVCREDVRRYAAKKRLSIETAARECRYQAFEKACEQGYIATAHTASDNMETLLLRICRGTGLRGLCGIPPVRGRYIRPMLYLSREDVENYLWEKGLSFVTDSTNAEDSYSRNYVRLHIVPRLRHLNPSLFRTLSSMTGSLREDMDFLEKNAASVWEQCRQPDGSVRGLEKFHPALQARCIAALLQENGISPDHRRITDVRELLRKGGRMELERGGKRALVGKGILWIAPPPEIPGRTELQMGKNQIFSSRYVEASCILRTEKEKFARIHTMFANSVLDYDIIKGGAVLHGREEGLRFCPAGREHSVSIKKWLNEAVALPEREYVHFLSDEEGLLWVQGLGAAGRAAVTERTQKMLLLRVFQ